MRTPTVVLIAFAMVVSACASPRDSSDALTESAEVHPAPDSVVVTTSEPVPTTESTVRPRVAFAEETVVPEFLSLMKSIDDETAERMSSSWRQGCPVPLSDLRLLTVSHHDYTGRVTMGELVVHADHASDIVDVFEVLYDVGFPIQRMRIVDEYGADDDASMRANNTSGFNCREIATSPGRWSNHAFGRAIDINPLVNPWVTDGGIYPVEGTQFADRTNPVQGGIYPGDPIIEAFERIGWSWGGNWNSSKDYQHFDVR